MRSLLAICALFSCFCFGVQSCKPKGAQAAVSGDAAAKVYVQPGKHDEFYNIVSGGFNGQMMVYGIPSGRLIKIIPVFSMQPENGYSFSEETKALLNTANGPVPWDDLHHIALSTTNGEHDGRWAFANGNNTPRLARVDLTSFRTVEILEIPNSAGNHASPFITQNTEYVVAATRFSVPVFNNPDVPISTYKENFKGTISFVTVDKNNGHMNLSFQILTPGVNFDLSRAGKGKSHGWFFFSCYNSEKANTLLEVNASAKDKDFIMAVNWKKAEEYLRAGKGKKVPARYASNRLNESTHTASSTIMEEVTVLDPKDCPDMIYFIPCPKSPHGTDVDPSGEYFIGSGKLAATIPVFSFTKLQQAIAAKQFDGSFDGIPVLKYEAVLKGEVQKPGLGPLHTEFDGKGNAYTSMFVSSEIVKWDLNTLKVLDRVPTYYSIGHLMVPGGPTTKPYGKYMVAYNKITKDRYLPVGPEMPQSAQLYDISGEKMKLLLDFPTVGEPHYAEAIPAAALAAKSIKIYKIEENQHPYATKGESQARVERTGNKVHVYMTAIRSHLAPDNIEGVKVGDSVFFHVTNLEQDWDVPHGFAIKGMPMAEILIMPGETQTYAFRADRMGMFPFYCTDFCSALHQEMQGYLRISPAGSNVALRWGIGSTAPKDSVLAGAPAGNTGTTTPAASPGR